MICHVSKPLALFDGRLVPVARVPGISGSVLDVDRLYIRRIDEGAYLVVDSISNSLDVVPDNIFRDVFVDCNCDSEYYGYYAARYGTTRDGLRRLIEEDLEEKVKTTSVIICPSYRCNCCCRYCYQQSCVPVLGTMDEGMLGRILGFAREILTDGVTEHNNLQLFGGEPFLPENEWIVKAILETCRELKVPFIATSNLVQMDAFRRMLYIYRGYIARICTTIDGDRDTHNRNRPSKVDADPFSTVVENIDYLLGIGIRVNVAFNVDRTSMDRISSFLDIAETKGWADNPLVSLEIGRVDDRLLEGCADCIVSESELLECIIALDAERGLPGNIRLAFLKAAEPLAQAIGLGFNQREWGRSRYYYCWASTPSDRIMYIDSGGNVFRCTYTVGRPESRVCSLEVLCPDSGMPIGNILLEDDECWSCSIGGYCSGGCMNTRSISKKRVCEEERANFDYFIDRIVIPWIRDKTEA